MGEQTKIAWCDHTFNPWIGCSKVSPGCANCYAEELMDTRYGRVQWGVNGTRVRTSESNWKQPYKWNRKAEAEGVRKRVFCASLADVFEDRPELVAWRSDLFAMIDSTPWLDWLLLTKRPENIKRLWPFGWYEDKGGPFTWPNVWIGISVENQEQADKRIPLLLDIPARVRFLSIEPLLGPVDLKETGALWTSVQNNSIVKTTPAWRLIHWVIVGGESGHNARPMHPEWARSIRDQCQSAGVPFFFKQHGEWICPTQWTGVIRKSKDYEWFSFRQEDGTYRSVAKVGKKSAGRLLDGREWSEFPS
jgi:protein gp37